MTIWLVHGFNVSDAGKGSVQRLAPSLDGDVRNYSYGWVGLINLRCTNRRAVKELLQRVKPGDVLIGHSNGCLICWEVAQRLKGDLGAVVCINPALRRDTLWPDDLPVLCLANSTDWVVTLGRFWSRLVSPDKNGMSWWEYGASIATDGKYAAIKRGVERVKRLFKIKPLGWGAAGRNGFTSGQESVSNWDTSKSWWKKPVEGHSGLFDKDTVGYWGALINRWIKLSTNRHKTP